MSVSPSWMRSNSPGSLCSDPVNWRICRNFFSSVDPMGLLLSPWIPPSLRSRLRWSLSAALDLVLVAGGNGSSCVELPSSYRATYSPRRCSSLLPVAACALCSQLLEPPALHGLLPVLCSLHFVPFLADILFIHCSFLSKDGGVPFSFGSSSVGDDVKVIDAAGKYVMPGGIDPHAHLEMDFMGTVTIDDFYTGQAAALAGGTTMHIDFVNPSNGTLSSGFASYKVKAEKSVMDYGFHMVITKWDDAISEEMELMVKENGINSFKFFMAYKGSVMINDELLLQGLEKCKSLGALAMVHAENGDGVVVGQRRMIDLGITGPEGHALSRPPVLEGEATARAIRLASFVNTPLYVVHVMSIDAMEEIAKARQSGQRVIGEPVVSGLTLDESRLWNSDFTTAAKYVMSPPIRKAGHDIALQNALAAGILQLVGTDHCTFNSTQKSLGYGDFRKIPNGVNGIEERMHLIWDTMVESGKITASDYVRITSAECAKIFNIYPRKGAILEGSDADVIVLNPNASFRISALSHHSRSDTNVYEGRTGKGKVEVTISGGRVVWEDENLKVTAGSGKYIKMPPFGYLFNGIDQADARYLASLNAHVLG